MAKVYSVSIDLLADGPQKRTARVRWLGSAALEFTSDGNVIVSQYLNKKLQRGNICMQYANVDVIADDTDDALEKALQILAERLSVYRVDYDISNGDIEAVKGNEVPIVPDEHVLNLVNNHVRGCLWATCRQNVQMQTLDWLVDEIARLRGIEEALNDLFDQVHIGVRA